MARGNDGARKRRRIYLAAVVALAVVGLAAAARLLVPAGAVRDLVAARLTAAMGRTVTVGEARGGLLPSPWIEVRDLAAAEGPEGVAVSLDALRLGLRWGPLLRREVQIDRAELSGPRVAVRLLEAPADSAGGRAGAGGPAAAPATLPVSLSIEHFLITGGQVTIARADGAPVAALYGLGEDLSLQANQAGDLAVTGTTTVDSLRIFLPTGTLGQGLKAGWRKDLRWEAAAGRLQVVTSELTLGELPVAVTGEVTGLAVGQPVADLRLAGGPVQLASLQGYIPSGLVPQLEGVRSSGTAELQAAVAGPLGGDPQKLTWSLRFALAQGLVEHPALGAPVRDITVVVTATPGLVTIENAGARTERSRFALQGSVSDPLRDPSYDLTVSVDADLAELTALAPPRPDAPAVTGRAAATLRARGRAADPASVLLEGPLSLTDVALSGPSLTLPVTGLGASGRLAGRVLHLDALALKQGRSDYSISGTVADPLALLPTAPPGTHPVATVDLEFSSTLLDVDEILAAGAQAKAAARQTARAAGSPQPAAAPAPPAALDYLARASGRADVRIGTLLIRANRLTELAGTVQVDRGLITMDGATARIYGGAGRLAGLIDLADPRAGRLDLQLEVAGVRAEQYFAESTVAGRFTRLATALTGGLDLSTTLRGALDDTMGLDLKSLTAGGNAFIHDARLTGLPLQAKLVTLLDAPQLQTIAFQDLKQVFKVENGRLTLDKLAVKAGPVAVLASGWQALDGEMSAHLDLTLPPDYAQGLRRQLPAQMADLLLDAEGTALVLPVTVSGRAADPDVRLDTDKLAAAAGARAEARLARETDRLKQQAIAEASRSLQDLLKLPADTAAAAGDSAAAPTIQDLGRSLLDRLKAGKKGGG